jgi:LysM repeat protein
MKNLFFLALLFTVLLASCGGCGSDPYAGGAQYPQPQQQVQDNSNFFKGGKAPTPQVQPVDTQQTKNVETEDISIGPVRHKDPPKGMGTDKASVIRIYEEIDLPTSLPMNYYSNGVFGKHVKDDEKSILRIGDKSIRVSTTNTFSGVTAEVTYSRSSPWQRILDTDRGTVVKCQAYEETSQKTFTVSIKFNESMAIDYVQIHHKFYYKEWIKLSAPDIVDDVTDTNDDFERLKPELNRGEHEVRPGESLKSIAQKYGTTVSELKKMNMHLFRKHGNWNQMYPGDIVRID